MVGTRVGQLMVTIRCLTYNHEPYIRQCLEGFVIQKTNFPFEAIVHDDASTDGTAAIIREYAEKYPDIIKPIFETVNQYSKQDGSLKRILDAHTHGKYVAMCEGDDYWTDPYKLQKQVDFLESHPDFVMCSHRWQYYGQKELIFGDIKPKNIPAEGKEYGLNDLIFGRWFFQPVSVLYKMEYLDNDALAHSKYSMDIVLFYELLKNGKGYCLSDTMAVYRTHQGGAWTGSSLDKQRLMEFKAKLAIYDIEKTKSAAIFLLSPFTKVISRLWMIRHFCLFFRVWKIFIKHFGASFANKLFLKKMILNTRICDAELESKFKGTILS